MTSRVNEVNGENLQDPPIKNPGYANGTGRVERKTDMLRSIGKQSGESVELVQEKKIMVGYGGKDLQKRKVLSLE